MRERGIVLVTHKHPRSSFVFDNVSRYPQLKVEESNLHIKMSAGGEGEDSLHHWKRDV